MEDIFKKGNKITTNGYSCFLVIDFNEYQVVCKDLLTDDFEIFNKSEHLFSIINPKEILKNNLVEVLNDININEKDKFCVLEHMEKYINAVL